MLNLSPKVDGEIKDAPSIECRNSVCRQCSGKYFTVLLVMKKVEFIIILMIYSGSVLTTRE